VKLGKDHSNRRGSPPGRSRAARRGAPATARWPAPGVRRPCRSGTAGSSPG
jgi:hypothetical protein